MIRETFRSLLISSAVIVFGAAPSWSQTNLSPFQLKFLLDPAIPVSFTRPMFPYPMVAKYKGSGDPNDAKRFKAVGRNSPERLSR